MSAKVLAFINLKGGVAKTTTTAGVAMMLAGEFHKKVLVIDLDPQTNCTIMLIGENRWAEINRNGYTIATLFKDAVDGTRNFNLDKTIQKKVSNVRDVTGTNYWVDLLPSSIDMIDIQDRLITAQIMNFYAVKLTDILKNAAKNILGDYDYFLIDCPPNMGLITLNGLSLADGYIIPAIPDVLSTYGIPQIISRVESFSEATGKNIPCLGIVATKRRNINLHTQTLNQLRADRNTPVFETVFNENSQMASAAEFGEYGTLRQKWGYQGQFDKFYNFTREILNKI